MMKKIVAYSAFFLTLLQKKKKYLHISYIQCFIFNVSESHEAGRDHGAGSSMPASRQRHLQLLLLLPILQQL